METLGYLGSLFVSVSGLSKGLRALMTQVGRRGKGVREGDPCGLSDSEKFWGPKVDSDNLLS